MIYFPMDWTMTSTKFVTFFMQLCLKIFISVGYYVVCQFPFVLTWSHLSDLYAYNLLVTEVLFLQEWSRSTIEVHKKYRAPPNSIKIISRSLNHQMTATIARASRRRAAITTPLLEPAWDSQEVFVHVPLRTSALEPKSSTLNPWIDLIVGRQTCITHSDQTNPHISQCYRRDRRRRGGIPYSCLAHCDTIANMTSVDWPNSNFRT
jgi:hypothetical protein